MSQGRAPSTGACDFAVLRAVPGPSWGRLRLALPAVIEQFEPLMQGDECLSKRHAQASMPNDYAQLNQRSRHVSLQHDPRLEASSQPSRAWTGTAALMTPGLYGVPQHRTTRSNKLPPDRTGSVLWPCRIRGAAERLLNMRGTADSEIPYCRRPMGQTAAYACCGGHQRISDGHVARSSNDP